MMSLQIAVAVVCVQLGTPAQTTLCALPGPRGVLSVAPALAAPQQPLVIDGSKNPDAFPEWFIWEMIFKSLPDIPVSQRTPIPPPHVQLGVSEEDLAFLRREVRLFQQHQKTLAEQLQQTMATLRAKGKSEDEIRDATRELDLAYRLKILDARSRVYETLPPESVQLLLARNAPRLKGTKVYLRGRSAQYFWAPW